MDEKGQGALEYLLLIAGAVLVAAVVIYLLSTMAGTGKTEADAAAGKVGTNLDDIGALSDPATPTP